MLETNRCGDSIYNIGMSEREFTLILMLIDDKPTSDEEEDEIAGLRRRIVAKRKILKQRTRNETK